MKKFTLLFGIGLFCLTLVSCNLNKGYNCVLYGSTSQNDNGEIVAKFTKSQRKTKNCIEIYGSKAQKDSKALVAVDNRGIVFNKTNVGYVNEMIIDIKDQNFESAKIFYGNNPLPIENSQPLVMGENVISLNEENKGFFVIQNLGAKFNINSITVTYSKEEVKPREDELHSIYINTENKKNVTSLIDYVNCQIVTDEYEEGLPSQVRVRGNSTANLAKKPYRIKLEKKTSLFGYKKSKNYTLLADILDASKMHNYVALSFSKLIRDTSEFAPNPMHVNVYLNDEYRGLYLLCEHIDEKSEHMNLAQDDVWNLDFDNINFYLDRDYSAQYEQGAAEGETYLEIKMQNYPLGSYLFEMKYPEKEDFIEEKDDKSQVFHETEWNSYVSNLRTYLTDVCQAFVNYYASPSAFDQVNALVDVTSLAKYGVVDQLLCEADHINKSFKVFKNGGKLEFGPCWDYDSCSFGFPYVEGYTEDPFDHDASEIDYIFDLWTQSLYNDVDNGKPLYKSIWDSITQEEANEYINGLYQEIAHISYGLFDDCDKWVDKKYSVVFDNLSFVMYYLPKKVNYLKNTIYS